MATLGKDFPLVVIAGETGSGKSALAIELALRFDGEIVSADSRAIYRGMDIGTAKPLVSERAVVAHHLIDVASPDEPLTSSQFADLSIETIHAIAGRGKLPIVVGGTGLYIDALLFGYEFGSKPNAAVRAELSHLSVAELQQRLVAAGIPLPQNQQNPRHLIRQLETGGVLRQPRNLRPNTLVLYIEREKDDINERIEKRVDTMLAAGLEREVAELFQKYGFDNPVLGQTIGYQEFIPYLRHEQNLAATRQAIIAHTRQYAKRQRTWFRRYTGINRICKSEQAVDLITTLLNNNR